MNASQDERRGNKNATEGIKRDVTGGSILVASKRQSSISELPIGGLVVEEQRVFLVHEFLGPDGAVDEVFKGARVVGTSHSPQGVVLVGAAIVLVVAVVVIAVVIRFVVDVAVGVRQFRVRPRIPVPEKVEDVSVRLLQAYETLH